MTIIEFIKLYEFAIELTGDPNRNVKWLAFGTLWDAATKQEWFWRFMCEYIYTEESHLRLQKIDWDKNVPAELIEPQMFAISLKHWLTTRGLFWEARKYPASTGKHVEAQ